MLWKIEILQEQKEGPIRLGEFAELEKVIFKLLLIPYRLSVRLARHRHCEEDAIYLNLMSLLDSSPSTMENKWFE